jgi:hypothetical protein
VTFLLTRRERLTRTERRRAERLSELKPALEKALASGEPLRWSAAQRMPWCRLLEAHGISLRSRTHIKRLGCKLKPDAVPVVVAYFGGAVKYVPLYWVGRQTEPPPPAPLFEARA